MNVWSWMRRIDDCDFVWGFSISFLVTFSCQSEEWKRRLVFISLYFWEWLSTVHHCLCMNVQRCLLSTLCPEAFFENFLSRVCRVSQKQKWNPRPLSYWCKWFSLNESIIRDQNCAVRMYVCTYVRHVLWFIRCFLLVAILCS